nr:exodeoxyribonuclease VII large subunit [Canibacter oris]
MAASGHAPQQQQVELRTVATAFCRYYFSGVILCAAPSFQDSAKPSPREQAAAQHPVAAPSRENPLSVAQINTHLQRHIETLGAVWAEGELTEWNLRRMHYYGKLRDPETQATLQLALWRNPKLGGKFTAGDKVVLQIAPNYWVPGGTLSFVVQQMEHRGLGKLLQELNELREKLTAEGLFAAERKKPLPFLPHCIGLITGKDSDAERDVLVNAKRRWPNVNFRVVHTAVQGERTVAEVIAALQQLDADSAVDVIVIARGGGDFQHLLPFSDESLLRAVAATATPVVSAIGHEPDHPLLDEVADLRASTPTDAAKRIVPDVAEEFANLTAARSRLYNHVLQRLNTEMLHLASYRSRPVLSNPELLISQQQVEIERWASRALELTERRLHDATRELQANRSNLRALSPLATLQRGYAVAQLLDGTVVQNPQTAPAGTPLQLHLAGGKLRVVAE